MIFQRCSKLSEISSSFIWNKFSVFVSALPKILILIREPGTIEMVYGVSVICDS